MRLAMMMMVAVLAGGCMKGGECQISDDEGGGSRIECPGREAVITDEPVSEDAKCQARDGRVVCTSGQTFEVPGKGKDAGGADVSGGMDAGGDGGVRPAPGATGGVGSWESKCQAGGGQVVCADGARAAVDELGPDASCSSRMMPGVGRRIVCEDGTVVRPADGSVDGIDVTCERRGIGEDGEAIVCSDGSFVTSDAIPGDCEPHAKRDGDHTVVVSCGAYEVQLDSKCNRTIVIENQEDLDDFEQLDCEAVWGDFIIQGSELERINPWGRIAFIGGKLIIQNNDKLKSFGQAHLGWIGKGIVVQDNPELTHIGEFGRLWGVGGDIEYSGNEKVRWIEGRPFWWLDGSWLITGEKSLVKIGEVRDGQVEMFLPPDLTIDKSFMFLDSPLYGVCRAEVVWQWARAVAESAYIGNVGKGNQQDCPW